MYQFYDIGEGGQTYPMKISPVSKSKRIIGLPEQITSDIGSVGDMAASAEMAFGTILQRSMAVLGARMHPKLGPIGNPYREPLKGINRANIKSN